MRCRAPIAAVALCFCAADLAGKGSKTRRRSNLGLGTRFRFWIDEAHRARTVVPPELREKRSRPRRHGKFWVEEPMTLATSTTRGRMTLVMVRQK